MPKGDRSDWYLPALIVGTALAAFLLGSATMMWLGSALLPVAAHGAASARAPSNELAKNQTTAQTTGPSGASAGPTQTPAAQTAGPGSPQPAEAAAASAAPPHAAATASATQPAAAPASAPGPASPPAPQGGNFALQLGAFLDAAKAKSLADQLAVRGYSPASVDAADGYGRTWHYVRVGAFGDEHAAAQAASDLLERAGIGAAVVRLPGANAGR
jgi:cell division protein FtsN